MTVNFANCRKAVEVWLERIDPQNGFNHSVRGNLLPIRKLFNQRAPSKSYGAFSVVMDETEIERLSNSRQRCRQGIMFYAHFGSDHENPDDSADDRFAQLLDDVTRLCQENPQLANAPRQTPTNVILVSFLGALGGDEVLDDSGGGVISLELIFELV